MQVPKQDRKTNQDNLFAYAPHSKNFIKKQKRKFNY